MKTSTTILFLLFVTMVHGQTKEEYTQIGDSLLLRGQQDALINYFEIELEKDSKNENVLRWLGYAHLLKNDLDIGEKYYKEALLVNPNCARCYLNLGRVNSMRGDNEKALIFLDKAVEIDEKDAVLYSNRAKLKEMLGDKFGALDDHNKAVEIEPENSNLYLQRGLYYSTTKYQALAISNFTKAIRFAPENYSSYFQRASIFYNQKQYNAALKDMNKAIEIDSNQYSLYTGRGAILDVKQEYQKAIDDYTKAISLSTDDFLPYLNRASANYKLERLDATCADYFLLNKMINKEKIDDKTIIEEVVYGIQNICDTSKSSYYYQRGIGFYNQNKYQQAIDVYKEGLKKFPEHSMMLAFMGNAYLALEEYDKGIESYSLSLNYKNNILTEIKSNSKFANASNDDRSNYYNGLIASTHFSRSECKINLGQWDEALLDINKALELAIGSQGIHLEAYYNLRGHIYLLMEEYKLAKADFTLSIASNSGFALAYVNRALVKVSLAEKMKISSYFIGGKTTNLSTSFKWNLPKKTSRSTSETELFLALEDCDKAIRIEPKLGFAFYIRGQIKQLLKQKDFCVDLLTAQELGIGVEVELLNQCGK